jgi:hypothetical protein
MEQNVVIAIVSASSAVVVSIVALIVNVVWMGRAFSQLDSRFGDFGKRMDRIEAKLGAIESTLASYVLDVATIKARLGL